MKSLFSIPGVIAYSAMLFLNAFVDLGHKIVIQNTLFKTTDGDTQVILTAIVNGLILLPYILLFSPSGYLSDKYPKQKIMRFSAWAAVAITSVIAWSYWQGWFYIAFAMTFLMAVQSAFYAPAKYGYIKELVGSERLGQGNALVQGLTTVAILAGIFAFSVLFEQRYQAAIPPLGNDPAEVLRHIAPIGLALVAVSIVELILAYRLPCLTSTDTQLRFEAGEYLHGRYLKDNLSVALKERVIRQSIIGLALFWGISQVLVAAFPAFAKAQLGETNTIVIQGVLAFAGIGIVIGSSVAGRLGRHHIETGLIPLGALGVAACLFAIPWLSSPWQHALNFCLLGAAGALLIVPLNALIQFNAGEHALGRVLAANNFLQNIVMVSFLLITSVAAYVSLDSRWMLMALAGIGLLGALYTLWKLPQALLRFLLAWVIGIRYKLRVIGLSNLPSNGGVLMLGNHVSWLDWALIQMASPRPVRFVMERSIYQRPWLKPLLDLFDVIPIARGHSKEALASIRESINAGEVVCLFPEGVLSHSGQLAEFKSGFERAAKDADGVIVPFYLGGLWGSRLSRADEGLKWRRKSGPTRRVVVAFGEPLPIESERSRVKQVVRELSIQAWETQIAEQSALNRALLDNLCVNRGELALVDALTDSRLSKRRLLAASGLLASHIGKHCPEQNIGILLPPGAAGAIVNIAVQLLGKTAVNLNFTASEAAIQQAVGQAGLRHVIGAGKMMDKLAKRGFDPKRALAGAELLELETIHNGFGTLQRALAWLAASLLPAAVWQRRYCWAAIDPEQTAVILFSSGSEGAPKGIELSHRNVLGNVRQIADVLNIRADDSLLANLPLFHAFGLTVTTFLPLIEAVPMVCLPDATDSLAAARAIAKYRVRLLFGTSTFLRMYARNRRIPAPALESVRLVVAGAERLDPQVAEAFQAKFNKAIYQGYGATETTPVATVNLPDRFSPKHWYVQTGNKEGSVGLPLPGTNVRVVDPQTLEELPVGEDGMILIGGIQVMRGYLGQPEKTAQVIVQRDGRDWYVTGDKGHIDADGFLSIVDRYSRFAKLGGEMVSLAAVEQQAGAALKALLSERPGFSDDAPQPELIATTLPDAKKGERIVLLIAQLDEAIEPEGIKKRLLQSGANPLTIPAQLFRIEQVPTLGSGKTDYHSAKQLAAGLV